MTIDLGFEFYDLHHEEEYHLYKRFNAYISTKHPDPVIAGVQVPVSMAIYSMNYPWWSGMYYDWKFGVEYPTVGRQLAALFPDEEYDEMVAIFQSDKILLRWFLTDDGYDLERMAEYIRRYMPGGDFYEEG